MNPADCGACGSMCAIFGEDHASAWLLLKTLDCWMLESLALASCSRNYVEALLVRFYNFKKQCLGELPSMLQRRNLLVALVFGGSNNFLWHIWHLLLASGTCQRVALNFVYQRYVGPAAAVDHVLVIVPVSTGVTVAHTFGKQISPVFQRVFAGMFLCILTCNLTAPRGFGAENQFSSQFNSIENISYAHNIHNQKIETSSINNDYIVYKVNIYTSRHSTMKNAPGLPLSSHVPHAPKSISWFWSRCITGEIMFIFAGSLFECVNWDFATIPLKQSSLLSECLIMKYHRFLLSATNWRKILMMTLLSKRCIFKTGE